MNIPLSIATLHPFEPQVIIYLVIVVVLLFCSAMMSGSETSLFSLTQTQLEKMRKRNGPSDQAVFKLLSVQDQLLATVLIANNLVNICIVILSNNIIDQLLAFDSAGWEFAVKSVIVTFVLLLFGEIMPKIYAAYNPVGFARMVARPLLGVRAVLKPFSWLLIRSGNRFNEKAARKRGNISIDELSDAMEITQNQTEEERQMLSGIVSFVNTEAAEIMNLRPDIVALDIEEDFSAVKRVIIDSGLSRIPAYAENIDNIKGVLYVKDMVAFIGEDDDFAWQRHLRKAYFVPEHKKISDLLGEFQTSKVHMAIVVDEYGATQGLVSLEDILEEIVGEITDESDHEQANFYQRVNENTYIFDGKTHLVDLEKVLDLDEDYFQDVCGGSETIAGLMLELNRNFLKKGESVSSQGITFTVNALDGRRIDKVKVVVSKAAPKQA